MPDKWAAFAQPAPQAGGADKWAKFAQQPDIVASPPPTPAPAPVAPSGDPRDLVPNGGFIHDHVLGPGVHVANRMAENITGLIGGIFNPPSYAQMQQQAQQQVDNLGKPLTPGSTVEGVGNLIDPVMGGSLGTALRGYGHTAKTSPSTAVQDVVGDAGTAALLAAITHGLTRSPKVIPGENFTATQLKAHTGILGRMNGLGDNFIPQDAAASTGSVIRQAAADNPTITAAATRSGSTPQNIAALQAILQKANTSLEAPHAATIAQHAAVPADVTGVQASVGQSFPKTLSGVSPEDAAAIQQLQQRLGTVNTLGGLNDLRQWLNDEAASGYKQDGIAAARGTATKAGIRAAADAARNAYYDQLQHASGTDFRPIKAQQSALLDQQEGAAKLGQSLSAQQAVADEPKSGRARVGEALTGGRALKAGPIAGIAQLATEKLLGQKPLTQPNYLIRNFLSNLPDPTPTTPQGVAIPPLNSPRLAANATPQVIQGTPVSPPPQAPPTLQLTQALQRLLPQTTSEGSVPAYQQSVSPPPVNPSTAKTRIAPTRFAPSSEVAPTLTRPVTPSGQVMTPLQRFLQAGDLEKSVVDPSTDDLKRAIANMRKRKGGA